MDMGELEVVRREGVLVAERDGGMELAAELAEFMGYCCAEKGNNETTIAGKLVAISFTASSLWGYHCH